MRIFKYASLFFIPVGLLSCGNNKVDNSSCLYIGENHSSYVVTAGSGDNFRTMQFFFYPNGYGSWGTTKVVNGETVVDAFYEFDFTLSGDVNVRAVQRIDKETFSGYFTTTSSGQAFVISGTFYYRFS